MTTAAIPQNTRFFTPWRLACLAILILAGAVYLPAMTGTFVLDDLYLVSGKGIGGGKSFVRCFTQPFLSGYYRPLVSVSFFLENRVSHNIPFFYHQTNLLIHVLTTGLLITLLRRTFPQSRRIALLGGLLFAVQPIQVGAVAWIGGRTDSLCTLFLVLFGLLLARAVQATGKARAAFLCGAIAAYAGAVFTKEQMLPACLLVPLAFVCFSPQTSRESRRAAWPALLPFLLVAVLFLKLWAAWGPEATQPIAPGWTAQAAQGGRTITYYALALFAPSPRWMHTFSLGALERWGAGSVLLGYGLLGLAALLFRQWRKSEPAAAWFLAWICLTLALVSNLVPLTSIVVAPYRAGAAGVGSAALIAWALATLSARASLPASIGRQAAAGAAVLCLLWWGGLTWWGAAQWQRPQIIFTDFARYDPDSIWARFNLATALLNDGKTPEAIQQLEELLTRLLGTSRWETRAEVVRAVETDPSVAMRAQTDQGSRFTLRVWLARVYTILGDARLDADNRAGAKRAFEIARALNAGDAATFLGLGECAYRAGDYQAALRANRLAVTIAPRSTQAHFRLGRTLAGLGQWKAARAQYAFCVREEPEVGVPYFWLAEAQLNLGDRAGAEQTLNAARATPVRQIAERLLADLHANRPLRFDF